MDDELAFAVIKAARRLSDKRTLMDGGFWISKREMRYIDDALAAFDESLPTADDVRGVLRDDPEPKFVS